MGLFDIKQLKCKTCGEPLDMNAANDGVIKCGVCDSRFTLPKVTAEQKVLDYLFQAEGDLDTGRFEEAYTKYSKAAELDKTEPEAYFGMALAEHKIQYLKDEVNNRLQPVCHEISDSDFSESPNFLKALRYATEAQRAEYERKAEEINYIKNEFYKIAKSGVKYDCFICVKVSDENGGRTQDYKTADDIYFELKGKGYKPFFSERELVGVTGADYEARILYALYSSECMLVVCFDEGYLRTKWVKNEYSRFLKLVNDEEKESDSIALVFNKKPIEKLPNKHGKIQGIAINSLTAMERIVSFVDNHTPEAKKRREEEKREREEAAKRKAAEDEALRKRLEMLEEMLKTQQSAKKEEEEKLRKEAEEKARKELQEHLASRQRETEEELRQRAEERAREEAKRKEIEAQARRVEEERKREVQRRKAIEEQAKREKERKEREKREAEERARQEAERKAKEERERIARDFKIENGVLKKYNGSDLDVVIPNSVTSIGDCAFSNCSSLISIAIPNSVTSIGDIAFSGCSSLVNITIPNSVASIGNYAFYNCYSLTNITIPNSVTSIGNYAFRWCSSLTSITIPNSVTSIGYGALFGCSSLTGITIPNSVTSIDACAFQECSNLTSITIPNGVTSIGSWAFKACISLTDINFDGTKKQWEAINKGKDWDKNSGDYTVYFSRGLTKKMKKEK